MKPAISDRQTSLKPIDIVVALQLAITPSAQFKAISKSTAISVGECHNAVRRLRLSQLVLPDERRPSVEALYEFLVHGAPFAFPPLLGASLPGVPTAHSSPAFHGILESADVVVWPHADGAARGQSLLPLYPAAALLPRINPPLYELLSIVDALRIGSTRLRKVAAELVVARFDAARQ
jgi:hypothetical protein